MNFNLKLKKIRTFRKMTQKELSEKIGLTDQHRIVQYEKGVRVPKKDLVDKMAKALDVNPYTLYDTAGRDASEMMELLFWLDEFNPSALHLFLETVREESPHLVSDPYAVCEGHAARGGLQGFPDPLRDGHHHRSVGHGAFRPGCGRHPHQEHVQGIRLAHCQWHELGLINQEY